MSAEFLTIDQVRERAPAAFASGKGSKTSDKFTPINTSSVVQNLIDLGWQPTAATQRRTRSPEGALYCKHMIRFRREFYSGAAVGDYHPELVLINANDGTSAYNFNFGIYRTACSNGLVVKTSDIESIRVRHVNATPDKIEEASEKIIERIPMVAQSIKEMSSIPMSRSQQLDFAHKAAQLRWVSNGDTPAVEPATLITPMRQEDIEDNLWVVMNRVQEKLIRACGIQVRTVNDKIRKARPVSSLDASIRINKGIWALAEEYKKAA